MEQPANEGICLTCGFLCRRDTLNLARADYHEITREDRNGGRLFLDHQGEHLSPCCFRSMPIIDEIQDLSGVGRLVDGPPERRHEQQISRNEAAKQVVRRDRNCVLWMEYQPGLGPQQHLRGKSDRDMEEARRTFLESLEQQRQAFERHLAASRDTFAMELNEASGREQKRTSKLTTRLTLVAILLALVQVATALTCESLLWTWAPWLRFAATGCP